MPGVTIGSNVVIGAGSVVVKDIPSDSVAVGNPCKVIRPITEEDKEMLGQNVSTVIECKHSVQMRKSKCKV